MPEEYRDCNGLTIADVRKRLPRAADFPPAAAQLNRQVRREYANEWDRCQICGTRGDYHQGTLDPHHIIGGFTRAKSDERTNIIMLCNDLTVWGGRRCHEVMQGGGDEMLRRVLYAKWKTNPEDTDWMRLTLLRGTFLPEIEA